MYSKHLYSTSADICSEVFQVKPWQKSSQVFVKGVCEMYRYISTGFSNEFLPSFSNGFTTLTYMAKLSNTRTTNCIALM